MSKLYLTGTTDAIQTTRHARGHKEIECSLLFNEDLRFRIDTTLTLSDDHKQVYLTINLPDGKQEHKIYDFQTGKMV